MIRRWLTAAALAVTLLVIRVGPARGYELSDNVEIFGHGQVWLTVVEEMEEMRGLYQHPSGDEASQLASGFRISSARLGTRLSTSDDELSLTTQLKLERDPGLLDLYGRYQPARWLGVYLGQLKVPSTYENLTSQRDLDFVIPSRFATALSDYALSRTTHASSLFYGNRSYQRDLGLAFKGEINILTKASVRYFLMIGNGLGGGLFIGGNTAREHVIANPPGNWLYAGRLEIEPVEGVLILGGHGSYNLHGDVVFNSGRAVLDVERYSWSADARLTVAAAGLQSAAAAGGGENLDDWDDNGLTDFRYIGGKWQLLWCLNQAARALTGWPRTDEHRIVLGLRYDFLETEMDESEVIVRERTWMPAVSYHYRSLVKGQLSWLLRRTDEPFQARLADDAIILSTQLAL